MITEILKRISRLERKIRCLACEPYTVYTALLNQTGTNAPVATVLQNKLGGSIVWTRSSTGVYNGTLIGAFPSGKTTVLISNSAPGYSAARGSNDTVVVETFDEPFVAGDGYLSQASIEIRVYP